MRISDWSSDVCSSDLSSVRVDRAGALSRTRRSVTQRLARWEGAARRTRRRACTLFRCLRTRADRSIVCAMLDRQAFLANTGLQRGDHVSALPEVPPPCQSPPGWTPARAGNSIAEVERKSGVEGTRMSDRGDPGGGGN